MSELLVRYDKIGIISELLRSQKTPESKNQQTVLSIYCSSWQKRDHYQDKKIKVGIFCVEYLLNINIKIRLILYYKKLILKNYFYYFHFFILLANQCLLLHVISSTFARYPPPADACGYHAYAREPCLSQMALDLLYLCI